MIKQTKGVINIRFRILFSFDGETDRTEKEQKYIRLNSGFTDVLFTKIYNQINKNKTKSNKSNK